MLSEKAMTNDELKQLCLSLMRADTEDEVIRLLKHADFWDDPNVWRFYGDYENNYNTIGNQQSRPDAALVEKVVNAVDARLMNECLVRGVDPEGPNAPKSICEAVALFFDADFRPGSPHAGQVKNWSADKRTKIARGITLVATGAGPRSGKNPCFTISDCGEGQTPERFPDTFLSLTKSNKLRIPFVQGKFNMGGTGVLKFCGRHGLQLIVSRRNPKILDIQGRSHLSDDLWGFTVVRREDPCGGRRSSVYVYLAPVDAESKPGQGGVLRFSADSLAIFPEGRDPYARESEWGTLVKLYEYEATGFKSHILMRDGLLSRIDLLLPDIALPIRLCECRGTYSGHAGSFETTLAGLSVRLSDDRGENLEDGFPCSCPIAAKGERMTATIYAFKKGKAESYRKQEGIIFTVNGQTHGHLTRDFFTRKSVGLSYLADSILVVVDCSGFSGRAREDLFMNSRDRLSGGDLRNEIEAALEEMLKQHSGLRDLKERRRREEIENRLADSKPLEEVLNSILKKSPTLANLFSIGNRASNPFKAIQVKHGDKPYKGNRFPTFFKFKGLDYGKTLIRETPKNMRARIMFETDAENDYFSRSSEPGKFSLFLVSDNGRTQVDNYVGPNLHNGVATLSVSLPEHCQVGHELHFIAIVTDPSRVEPFENQFTVRVEPEAEPSGSPGQRRKSPSRHSGSDREKAAGINLPKIIRVYERDWAKYGFDKFTALRIKHAGISDENSSNGEARPGYDFYVNMDNFYLKAEMKAAHGNPEVTRARFTYGMVLVGFALLQQEEVDRRRRERKGSESEDQEQQEPDVNIEEQVQRITEALAPVLIPMIESLGGLDQELPSTCAPSGEAT
jgi:hypothetical protein